MKKLIITAFIAVSGLAAFAQTPSENKNQAEIEFDTEVHDFGIIPQGVPATYTFTFKNTGKDPLIITNATATCGCTTPEWTREPIKKGEKGYIKATYNAANPGVFTKQVTVLSNGKRGTVMLTLKGDVKTPEHVTPTATPAGK